MNRRRSLVVLVVGFILIASLAGALRFRKPRSGYREVRHEVQPIEPELVPITAGPFRMGNPNGTPVELPVHEVRVSAYSIGRYEVTNEEYKRFCDATGREYPRDPDFVETNPLGKNYFLEHPRFPVVMISWNDMASYCLWLSARTGKDYHLPTEAQWEKAARGGLDGAAFPWGNERKEGMARMGEAYFAGPVAVGSYPPNGFGLCDMAGNVNEAVLDWYDERYYRRSPRIDPLGPPGWTNYISLLAPRDRSRLKGRCHVVRGGSWRAEWDWFTKGPEGRFETPVECGAREYLYQAPYTHFDLGFRIALGGVWRQ